MRWTIVFPKIYVRTRPSPLKRFFPEPAKFGTIFEIAHFWRFSPGCLTPSVYNFGEVSDYYLSTPTVQCTLQFLGVCFILRRRYLLLNFVACNPCEGDAWRICIQCHLWPRLSRPQNWPFQVRLQFSIDRWEYYKTGEIHLYRCFRFKITAAWSWRQTRFSFSVSDTQNFLSPNWSTLCTVLRIFDVSWQKRLNVVGRLEIFCPKMTVGHRENSQVPRCLTWRNFNIFEYKLRNG